MYLPIQQTAFRFIKAKLAQENILFVKASMCFHSLFRGLNGKDLGVTLLVDTCTTKSSGLGCLVRKLGSPEAGLFCLATDQLTGGPEHGLYQVAIKVVCKSLAEWQ